MYDHDLFVETVARFSEKLLSHYEVEEVLSDLADRLTRLLTLSGSGVALGLGDELNVVTTIPEHLMPLERYEAEEQDGPSTLAYREGTTVVVGDLELDDRWRGYRRIASEVGVRAVVGVPMRLGDHTAGVLDLYHGEPRDWSESDLNAAKVLANMATGYVINASSLSKQTMLAEQLQRALDNRLVIEQAKGVLAQKHNISVDVAFERIRGHARNHNVTVHELATAVVNLGLRL